MNVTYYLPAVRRAKENVADENIVKDVMVHRVTSMENVKAHVYYVTVIPGSHSDSENGGVVLTTRPPKGYFAPTIMQCPKKKIHGVDVMSHVCLVYTINVTLS